MKVYCIRVDQVGFDTVNIHSHTLSPSLLLNLLDHLLPGALGADDVLGVLPKVCQNIVNTVAEYLDEALAHHRVVADVAEEALVVPGESLEGDELGAAKSSLTCRRNRSEKRKTSRDLACYKIASLVRHGVVYSPVIGLVQAVQRLEKSCPKHSAQ